MGEGPVRVRGNRLSLGDMKMWVISQKYSEPDIGGRETCK